MTDTYSLIDTHAHLDGKEFQADLDSILARAAAAGVTRMISVGADIESSRRACELSYLHEALYCSVGVHPHDAVRVTEKCYDIICRLATETPKNVAIGEIGLDFYRDRSPRDIQERVFRRFLILASELSLPVIIHDRDAHEPILRIVREEKSRGIRGVFHCFSGDLEMARECVDLGFFLSIPGTVTFPSNEQLRSVVRAIPADHLLLETDCPYLAPVPFRGKRNEPSYMKITAEKVAELKGLSLEDVARITTLNAET
ncbi:MAG TPA: TatD family hydrolase, partial [Geobacteraceae bacterium]|nr:TatD family hydrolase [Geobacteraceae bacterium]